jgi:hypothetical protein
MRKTKKNYKGGQLNIRYPGFCDNNPSQCLEMLNQCNGGKMIKKSIKRNKKVERKHEKRGSGYSTILKGSDQTLCNDQTSSEKAQFGCLYNNDWAAGLGENAGVTAQMQANAAGPGQAGGRRKTTDSKKKTNRKKKNHKKSKKGGYTTLGFKTYPSYCDGKENWSQCGTSSTACGSAGGRKKKGGYTTLGFKTYPSYCDGKENWSQCGTSSTACGSAGGKNKKNKNKNSKNKRISK